MSDGSENSNIPQSMRYPIWLGRTIISFAHLSLHCTSQWILLILNDSWLTMISIISPENGAVSESRWEECRGVHAKEKIKRKILYLLQLVSGKGIWILTVWIALKHSYDEGSQPCSLTQNSWASKLLLLRIWILDGTDLKPFIQQMALMQRGGE